MDTGRLELSTQIIIEEALKRGVDVELLDQSDNFIRLKKGGHTEYIKQATKTSADTYISVLIMENKEVTKLVLRENGINTPAGVIVYNFAQAQEKYAEFKDMEIVIKPKSTNFGEGVAILKQGWRYDDFAKSVKDALEKDQSVLIEKFAEGKEYRFLVIDGIVAAILHRMPANVIGDGIHSIQKLVEIKNQNPLRGTGYTKPLEKIKLEEIEINFLASQGKKTNYIPKLDEQIFLRENSNISTGGDSIDYTDEVIDDYKKIAIKATKAVGAKICGADIIIKNIKEKPTPDNYSVIELNFNPALHIHNYPYQGKNRNVQNYIFELLGF